MRTASALTNLSIGHANDIGAKGAEHISKLGSLTNLSIGSLNDIGAKGAEHISKLGSLTDLSIGNENGIGADGAEHISKLGSLRRLTIGEYENGADGTRISDDEISKSYLLAMRGDGIEVTLLGMDDKPREF
eukprot:TRINITY_DN5036_c0_g1_i19.p1 TRINITY_DN5036_c0_g1~~TRINITY_DN5036_c0_g1_i19.p1  ORF type:complete len:132 (+),score=16.15 TRINITY_DN5036_c0_g1_i19:121-516(+)